MIKEYLKSPHLKLDWIGIRKVTETSTYYTVRNHKAEPPSQKFDQGYMIEVLHDGYFGYAATCVPSLSAIKECVEIAAKRAEQSKHFPLYKFSQEVRPYQRGEFISEVKIPHNKMTMGEIFERLQAVAPILKQADSVIDTVSSLIVVETETEIYGSNGTEILQRHTFVTSDLDSTASKNGVTQKRSDTESLQMGLEILDPKDLEKRAQKVGAQVLELLEAEECPTETCHLVLAPDQMMLQIHESIGHPLEMDRILGDERNYAGWSFVKKEDFGNLRYGSDLLNIVFDPKLKGEFASYAFDEIGHEASKEYLIEKGILKRGLGSLESQNRSKLYGVANQRASSWNRPAIDRMANINLLPGNDTFEEILGKVENGIYMETNRSWSIDDFRNKFQFGCEYARKIEKGKLTKVLKNPNYRAISTPFWNSLMALGNPGTFKSYGTMFCGKGEPNQAIRVGHASPVCAFKNIEVFGGAQ
jgi:predicted Zn-dependent protease